MTFLNRVPPHPWMAAFKDGGHDWVYALGMDGAPERLAINGEGGILPIVTGEALQVFGVREDYAATFRVPLKGGQFTVCNQAEAEWLMTTWGMDLRVGGMLMALVPEEVSA